MKFHKTRYITLAYIILSILAGISAHAQSAGGLSLEECIDFALRNNPGINAAARDVEKARILKGTAFNPPNTEVILKQETTGGGGPENGVAFSQDFDFPTVYTARYRSLEAQYRLEQSYFDVAMANLTKEVSSAYCQALYARQLVMLNRELGAIYEEFYRIADIRFKEGESGRLELMNAERVVEKNKFEETRLINDLNSSLNELRRLTSIEGDIILADTLKPLQGNGSAAADYRFEGSLQGAVSQNEIAVAERELALAKNQFLPGIRLGATAQAFIKGFNPYHVDRSRFEPGNFMGFEVGITIPLFFGAQRSQMKAAEAQRDAARLRYEYAASENYNEAMTLRDRLHSLGEILIYSETKALPRADEIKRIAGVSYALGEIDYIEYLANMETAYGIYTEYATAINDYNQTLLLLEAIQ